MSLILELPAELERRLGEEAAEQNLPVSEYAIQLLLARIKPQSRHRTGAELVAHLKKEGLIGTRSDIASEDVPAYARDLRKRAETRIRE